MTRDNSKTRRFRNLKTFLLGMLGVLCVIVGYALRLDSAAELRTLDMRFRYAAEDVPSDVVIIAIDDNSLHTVGRWPWPRETLAGIIETLKQCDAKVIMLDIILPRPQNVRLVHPLSEIYNPDNSETVADAPPIPIYDDAILAGAIAQAGNVFVPLLATFGADQRMANLVQLDIRIAELVKQDPNISFKSLTGKLHADAATPLDQFAKSYLHQRSLLAMQKFALPVASTSLKIPTGIPTAPPLLPFIQAAYGSGFVTYQSEGDGTVRRISLLGNLNRNSDDSDKAAVDTSRIFPQLALAVSVDAFAKQHGRPLNVSTNNSDITLTAADGQQHVIPVNNRGDMIINWRGGDVYISAAEVAAIVKTREQVKRNNRLKRITQLQLAEGRSPKLVRLFARLDTIDSKLRKIQRQRYAAQLYDPENIPPAPTKQLNDEIVIEQQIDAVFAAFRKNDLEDFYLATVPTEVDAKRLYDKLSGLLKRIDEIDAANTEKLAYIERRMKILSEKVAGKICVIGSTSTGAADIVPTPLNPLTPGIVVHANIIETLIAGDFIIETPRWINVLVIFAAGAVVVAMTVRFSILWAAGLTL